MLFCGWRGSPLIYLSCVFVFGVVGSCVAVVIALRLFLSCQNNVFVAVLIVVCDCCVSPLLYLSYVFGVCDVVTCFSCAVFLCCCLFVVVSCCYC